MAQPLKVKDIYVRLRVHQEIRSLYQVDADAMEAEKQHDPNLLLKLSRERLEQRATTALTPEAAIHTYKHCIIVGDPGAGKSTLLKHLALLAGEEKLTDLPNLPVHIELSAFAISKHHDLLEFAAGEWQKRYGFPRTDALSYLQTLFQQGQALLLCDALDETVAGISREEAGASFVQVSQTITNLASLYPLVPIVVTARKAGYHQRSLLAGFSEVEILDFRQEDISQFIQNWFALHPNEQRRSSASDLLTKLQRNPRIAALAANPLLLTLITLVYEDQLDLPERRAELYKQCVNVLLTKWDASRNVIRRREFKPEQKSLLLEEIAWHFHLQGKRYFSEPELLKCIATFLPFVGLMPEKNSQVLAEIAAENGLLKEQAHDWYGFLHLTLQEYFVALYAMKHQQFEVLFARRGNPWWEEVLLLYAGRLPDASGFLQRLLDTLETPAGANQTELFHTDLMLAGRCLAASAVVKQIVLRQDIVTRLFFILQSSPYTLTQKQAAETLAEIGGVAVQAQLVALLSNEQTGQSVRYEIASALGTLGERSVAPQLVALLSNEQTNQSVRYEIASALGTLGERSVAPQLVTLLSNEQMNQSIRLWIASALGTLGERSVAPQLVTLLSNEQMNQSVREKIASALGTLGERSVAPQLVTLLSNEQMNQSVREKIASALGTLGERSVAPQLVTLLSNEQMNQSVREKIASALGTLGERSVAPQLVTLLSNEQVDEIVRREIAFALGTLGERSMAPQLVTLLSNEQMNQSVRQRIAFALGTLGERSVAPQLVTLLSNEQVDEIVRERIAFALGTLGERSVALQLVTLLSNPPKVGQGQSVRLGIASALGTLGERSVVPQLVTLLSNEQPGSDEFERIALALGKLGERTIAPYLVDILFDDRIERYTGYDLRYEIADALGALGERAVVPQLVALLFYNQVDNRVRMKTATILSSLVESEEQVHILATHLSSSDIADSIHSALWTMSRRLELRILVGNGPGNKQVEVAKLSKSV